MELVELDIFGAKVVKQKDNPFGLIYHYHKVS